MGKSKMNTANIFNIQKVRELLSKAKEAYKREGIYHVVRVMYNLTFKKSYNCIYCKFLIYLKPSRTFTLQRLSNNSKSAKKGRWILL